MVPLIRTDPTNGLMTRIAHSATYTICIEYASRCRFQHHTHAIAFTLVLPRQDANTTQPIPRITRRALYPPIAPRVATHSTPTPLPFTPLLPPGTPHTCARATPPGSTASLALPGCAPPWGATAGRTPWRCMLEAASGALMLQLGRPRECSSRLGVCVLLTALRSRAQGECQGGGHHDMAPGGRQVEKAFYSPSAPSTTALPACPARCRRFPTSGLTALRPSLSLLAGPSSGSATCASAPLWHWTTPQRPVPWRPSPSPSWLTTW